MRNTIKYSFLFIVLLGMCQVVYAFDIVSNISHTSILGVFFEAVVCSLILFFCIKGVKSCFSKDTYKHFTASYHTEKIGYDDFYSKDNESFNIESIKRVKSLMEARKKNEFRKNSTINQHLKNKNLENALKK